MISEPYSELLGRNYVKTAMVYTHVLNRGGKGVRSPSGRFQEQPCKGLLYGTA